MPALTSKQLLDLIETPYTPAQRGAYAFLQRSIQHQYGPNGPSLAQQRFIREWEDYPTLERSAKYLHPGDRPKQLGMYQPQAGKTAPPALTQSDLMWLERIPRDPSQVSFEDAQHIASLANSIPKGMGLHSDARLVHAIWAPIKDFHDRKAAEVAIENASRRQAPIPSSAIAAVASAYRREYDQLTDDECLTRAANEVAAAIERRESQQQREIEEARSVIDAIEDGARSRSEVVRA